MLENYSYFNLKIISNKETMIDYFVRRNYSYENSLTSLYGPYDICPVCFWEDDPFQFNDSTDENGANKVSLIQGQKNFIDFGACERETIENVRRPTTDEPKDGTFRYHI